MNGLTVPSAEGKLRRKTPQNCCLVLIHCSEYIFKKTFISMTPLALILNTSQATEDIILNTIIIGDKTCI